jgi:pilus assembly protein CpaC
MSILSHKALLALATAIGWGFAVAAPVSAQEHPVAVGVKFQVRGASERMEMTVNGSRVVEFPFAVPRMLVNNPELVRVVPISDRSIQLSALRAGVTQLNVWDSEENVTSLDLIIIGDVRELDMTLKTLFPDAALRLMPLNSSLYISGFVPKAEMVSSITRVAQDYFPNIINDMRVGGVHKILLHTKVMEISRTKLRNLGFDWAQISSGGSFISQGVSGLLQPLGTITGGGGPTVRFGVLSSGGDFFGFVEALRQNELARLLAEPTIVTLDGRPATFNVGGQVPIPMQQSLGVTTVTYRSFGTQIDFVPIVLGNGMLRLEVRPDITEIDPSLRDSVTGVPGFRQRTADTAVEMKAGQTLAIAGLVFTREDSVNRGIPWLADLPWAGIPFRRMSNFRNDVELLIFVTPEFCDAMNPDEVPPCGPGQLTTTPTDCELYGRGYIEVPKNCPNGNCGPGMPGGFISPGTINGTINGGVGPTYEELPGQSPSATPMNGVRSAPSSRASNSSLRGRVTGTGTKALSASATRTGESPQNGYSPYGASGSVQKAPSGLQPAIIGPQGYDDLK